MYLTIKSRRFKKNISFFCGSFDPEKKYQYRYIYVNLNGKSGTLGNQICRGGGLTGPTLVAYSEEDFYRTSRAWWRSYLRENPIIEY